MHNRTVRIVEQQTLSDNWYLLKKVDFELQRRDGSWQPQTREVYDRGDGATIGLYNRAKRTVILTRQFRIPAYVNGHDGYLIETAAGLLDNAGAEERIRLEAEEETGYRVQSVRKVYEAFMSPGSVTERLHFLSANTNRKTASATAAAWPTKAKTSKYWRYRLSRPWRWSTTVASWTARPLSCCNTSRTCCRPRRR